MKRIYLDNNATTLIDPRVADQMISDLKKFIGNPSSIHHQGQQVRSRVVKARDTIAAFFKVKPQELIFNSGATEGINMVLRGIFGFCPSGHVITSLAEHSSVLKTVKRLEEQGCAATYLSPGLYGAVSVQQVREAIRSDTRLIVLMAANNETGVKTDIAAIAALAEEANIPFVVDGVALLGKESIIIPKGVSAMCFSGHKIHAPQGIGVTYLRTGFKLIPQITGGEQEYGRRAGTENVLGILALAKAIEILNGELSDAPERMRKLRDQFEAKVLGALPFVTVNGEGSRVCNTSNLAFHGVDGESLLIHFDQRGLAASHGSACSSGALEPSRVLLGMGLPVEAARSSIRFSLSRFTTEEEIEAAAEIVIQCANKG